MRTIYCAIRFCYTTNQKYSVFETAYYVSQHFKRKVVCLAESPLDGHFRQRALLPEIDADRLSFEGNYAARLQYRRLLVCYNYLQFSSHHTLIRP